jgi:hypothetical protein
VRIAASFSDAVQRVIVVVVVALLVFERPFAPVRPLLCPRGVDNTRLGAEGRGGVTVVRVKDLGGGDDEESFGEVAFYLEVYRGDGVEEADDEVQAELLGQ